MLSPSRQQHEDDAQGSEAILGAVILFEDCTRYQPSLTLLRLILLEPLIVFAPESSSNSWLMHFDLR